MFTYELQRRLAAAGAPTIAVAAHPGNARTEFGRDMSGLVRVESSPRSHDRAAQQRLWAVSERLTGVTYPVPSPSDLPAQR